MKYIFSYILLLIFQLNYSQCNSIKEVKLSNEVLVQTINKFIVDTETRNSEFKNLGYIEVKLVYYNKNAIGNDFSIKYQINDQYFKPNSKKDILPKYYLYSNDKLVLIYNITEERLIISDYKKKYQKKLDRIIKPYLNKPVHIKAKDKEGKVIIDDKRFIDEKFNIHSGIVLSIRNDNSFIVEKPKI